MIKTRTEKRFAGDNIYNSTAVGQTKRAQAHRGQSRAFDVALWSDSVHRAPADASYGGVCTIRADKPSPGSDVRYILAGQDVTAAVSSSQGLRLSLGNDGPQTVIVRVTLGAHVPVGTRKAATIAVSWREDLVHVDRVRAVVRVLR